MEAGEIDEPDCRVEAQAQVVSHSRKPDETHRCHFVQQGLLNQRDGSPDHVSLLLPVGGGRKLRQLLAHIQDGVLSVRPRFGIRTSHLKILKKRIKILVVKLVVVL